MPAADDDLVAGAVHKPCGFGRWAVDTVKNLDDATVTNGKRLSTCKGKPIRALIQAEAQAIRWTDDPDVDPAAALGMTIPVGVVLEYDGDLSKLRFIGAVAGGILNVSFYGA